jgi:hypothetical protein
MQTPNSSADAFTNPSSSPVGNHTPATLSPTDAPAAFFVYPNTRLCGALNLSNRMVLWVFVLHGRAKPFVGYHHDRCSVAGAALDR